MIETVKHMTLRDQVEFFTKQLVEIPGVNGTTGENDVANFLLKTIRSFPYFREHAECVWEQQVPEDSLNRKNVFAFLSKGDNTENRTVIYHAHMDTVGVEDFGAIRDDAFNPEQLRAFFETYPHDPDVQRDAASGEWMFGRGALDMQSGAAIHLANLLYFSEHLDQLPGNLLVMFNSDEESQHAGIKSAIYEIVRLQKEHGLDFIAAINADFNSPQYEGDATRYIYTGAAGKALPCFYIYGREAHVGDTLTGVDPNFIAAELTRRIHNNVDLCEDIAGEIILPPTCLHQRDNKTAYNVQTAISSYLYFNYFLYKDSTKDIMNKLLDVAKTSCSDISGYLSEQYSRYVEMSGLPSKSLTWDIEVISLETFTERLTGLGIDVGKVCETVVQENRGEDLRNLSFKLVEVLNELDPNKRPRIIVFFAPPYLPHNFLKEDSAREQAITTKLEARLGEFAEETAETFAIKRFFPYLADGSYFSIHESDEELESLLRNLPDLGRLYTLPVEKIRELNIPSINIGVFGKDGHKWTERVYKPYTFGVLPKLIRDVTVDLLRE